MKTRERWARRAGTGFLLPLALARPRVEVRVPEHQGWKRAVFICLFGLTRNRESCGITWCWESRCGVNPPPSPLHPLGHVTAAVTSPEKGQWLGVVVVTSRGGDVAGDTQRLALASLEGCSPSLEQPESGSDAKDQSQTVGEAQADLWGPRDGITPPGHAPSPLSALISPPLAPCPSPR